MRNVAVSLIAITFLLGLFFMPIFLKHLTGNRRIFIFLQQLAILCHLFCFLLEFLLLESPTSFFEKTKYQSYRLTEVLYKDHVKQKAMGLVQEFFNAAIFFLAFMQTWDVYKLVCDPFKYVEFARLGNIIKYLGWGFLACLLMQSDILTNLLLGVFDTSSEMSDYIRQHNGVQFGLELFGFIKLVVARLVFAVVLCRLAVLVRRSLQESSRVEGEQQGRAKKVLYRRLFYFCLVPQFFNILYLVPKILATIFRCLGANPMAIEEADCYTMDDFRTAKLMNIISECSMALGSLTYYLAFVVLFPHVRNTLMCKSKNNLVA